MKQLFLPIGLILSILFALLLPSGGAFISHNSGLKILVFTIFLVSGYQTATNGLRLDRKLGTLLLTAAVISLGIGPLLGLLTSEILTLSIYPAIGIILMSSMPPTLSSGVVITKVSGGNSTLALLLTISLNLLGICCMPFILDLCLNAVGTIDIDQSALLIKMLFFVLLPFGIGKTLRSLRKRRSIGSFWGYINSSCVIIIVYSSLSVSKSAFSGLDAMDYLEILIASAAVHLSLLAINTQAGKLLQLPPEDKKAMLFVTSQKTLPIALAVLASVQFDTGNAIIVCLVFHFFQLFVDSFLAYAMHKK
jgi:sodium/bile acid cotransporter 7